MSCDDLIATFKWAVVVVLLTAVLVMLAAVTTELSIIVHLLARACST